MTIPDFDALALEIVEACEARFNYGEDVNPCAVMDDVARTVPEVVAKLTAAYNAGVVSSADACEIKHRKPGDMAHWHHPADDDDRAHHAEWIESHYRRASDEWDVLNAPRRYDISDVHECAWLAWHAGAQYGMERWRGWCVEQIRALKRKETKHGA